MKRTSHPSTHLTPELGIVMFKSWFLMISGGEII